MLEASQLQGVLSAALATGGDFAELFFEDKDETNLKRTQGVQRGATTVHIHGAGLYLLSGTASVYVYTSDTSLGALTDAARRAARLLPLCGRGTVPEQMVFTTQTIPGPNRVLEYPGTVPLADKLRVVREAEKAARGAGPSVRHLGVDLFDNDQRITIVNSEGLWTKDRRVSCRLRLQVAVGDGALTYADWGDFTRAQGFEVFRQETDFTAFAAEFVRDADRQMRAPSAPSCVVPVVLEAGSCGTFWHESCGHPLEASAIAARRSEFCDKLGEEVASDKVTLVDDGSLPGLYGSTAVDDEGFPTGRTVLIENGVLRAYLCDRLGARRLHTNSTASGRRQGYAFAPTSRMNNTFLAPGTDEDEEMIRSIPDGLYVKSMGGGVGGREFSVEVKEGFWIKNGALDRQIRGLTLSGKGIDIIKRVDRVGKNLVSEGGSFCGADSGLCPVTSFQPRMRISSMAVGGGE